MFLSCPPGNERLATALAKIELAPNKDINSGVGSLGVLKTNEQWVLRETFGAEEFDSRRCAVFGANCEIAVATYNNGFGFMMKTECLKGKLQPIL